MLDYFLSILFCQYSYPDGLAPVRGMFESYQMYNTPTFKISFYAQKKFLIEAFFYKYPQLGYMPGLLKALLADGNEGFSILPGVQHTDRLI